MSSKVRKIKKNLKLESQNQEQPQETTPPPPVSPQDLAIQRQVANAFSSLVVSMRALNTQVNALALQNQSRELLLATLDQIDQDLGDVTDRMWALRQLVEAENEEKK